jgi:hypothetical protein
LKGTSQEYLADNLPSLNKRLLIAMPENLLDVTTSIVLSKIWSILLLVSVIWSITWLVVSACNDAVMFLILKVRKNKF